MHLDIRKKPKLRVANSKIYLNLGTGITSNILNLNSSKMHKLRVAMKDEIESKRV